MATTIFAAQAKTLDRLLEFTLALRWAKTRGEETATRNAMDVVSILGHTSAPREVTPAAIQGLILTLRQKGNQPSTINRKLAALSVMLKTAKDQGVIQELPKIPHLKESEGRVRFLSEAEQMELFLAIQAIDPTIQWLCRFLVNTGMRVGEALRLRWEDIHENTAHIRRTKADCPRKVPLTEDATWSMPAEKTGAGPFTNLKQQRLSYVWNKAKAQTSLKDDPEVVPHILRHTCASRLVQNGVPIQVVQQWLGHKSLAQTQRYAHLNTEQFDKAREVLEGYNCG